MTQYHDDTVLLDENGVTIRSYRKPNDAKAVEKILREAIKG